MIEYYFWVISDWALLGHDRLEAIARDYRVSVAFRPIHLLQVYDRTGGQPLPLRSPERRAYRLAELTRWTRLLGQDLLLSPRNLGADDGPASRSIIAAMELGFPLWKLARNLMSALWTDDADIGRWEIVEEIVERAGLPATRIIQLARQPSSGRSLQKFTDEAVAAGVFGSPSYIYKGELFWGQDRLDFLERAVSGSTEPIQHATFLTAES